jgi:arabinosaccharide transport system permease protein
MKNEEAIENLKMALMQDKNRNPKGRKMIASISSFILLTLFAVFTLAPFYFMVASSFKPGAEMFRNGITFRLQPEIMSLKNYFGLFSGS